MTKAQSFLLATLLLIGYASAAQNVNLVCQTVDTNTCPSGYRYRTTGTYETISLNSTYCLPVNQTCVPQNKFFNLQTCKIDYKNTACSTGVCFMYPSKPVCTLDFTCGTTQSPKTFTSNYTCNNCSDASGCNMCLFTSTNQFNASGQVIKTCLGPNCTQGIAETHATVSPCPNGVDEFGQTCTCCVTTTQVARFCTSNSPALSQSDVTTWFNKAQNPTKFQFKTSAILVSICMAILAIIY